MNRVIIAGSPRSNGRSAHLAEMLFETCIEECPEDEVYLAPVSELEIGACIGCGGCSKLRTFEVEGEDAVGEDGEPQTVQLHRCVFDDDMTELHDLLLDADELIVVSPVYFSGAPAPMKALLDRMQPFFYQWLDERAAGEGQLLQKRPAVLHVVGEGGDANGYVPLVGEVRSALAVAGFKLERVFDWVGKIDADGEILEDAVEYALPPLGEPLATLPQVKEVLRAESPAAEEQPAETVQSKKQTRPKLDLSAPSKKSAGTGAKKKNANAGAKKKDAGAKSGASKGGSAKSDAKSVPKKGKRRG